MTKTNNSDPDPDPDTEALVTELVGSVSDLESALTKTRDEPDPPASSPTPADEQAASQAILSGPADYVEPWNRQPDETPTAWKYFKHYRDQGLGRTHAVTAEHYGVSRSTINNTYARPYKWADRIRAWDRYQDTIYQQQRVQGIREMADRHTDQVMAAIESLLLPGQALALRVADDPDFLASLSKSDAKKLIQLHQASSRVLPNMFAAERLARGMPTELVEHTGEVGLVSHDYSRDQVAEIIVALGGTGALAALGGEGAGDERGGAGEPEGIVDAEIVDEDPG